jgi:hypothetical protein
MTIISPLLNDAANKTGDTQPIRDTKARGAITVQVDIPATVTAGTVSIQARIDPNMGWSELYLLTAAGALQNDLREIAIVSELRGVIAGYTGTGTIVAKVREG